MVFPRHFIKGEKNRRWQCEKKKDKKVDGKLTDTCVIYFLAEAGLAAEAELKAPEDRTEDEKMALMGRPKLGDITRAQIRIKESKEFKNTVDKLVQRANASLILGKLIIILSSVEWKIKIIDSFEYQY